MILIDFLIGLSLFVVIYAVLSLADNSDNGVHPPPGDDLPNLPLHSQNLGRPSQSILDFVQFQEDLRREIALTFSLPISLVESLDIVGVYSLLPEQSIEDLSPIQRSSFCDNEIDGVSE